MLDGLPQWLSPRAREALERRAADCPDLEDRLSGLLTREQWALWGTLYVDSSNAGHDRSGRGWAWGARGRIGDELAGLLGVESTFAASGPSPLAGTTTNTGLAELWGVYYAARELVARWPFLVGVGVRCDSRWAVAAVAGCDGRRAAHHGRYDAEAERARDHLREVLTGASVLVRAAHVRGHGRADLSRQRAFNRHSDSLARRVAREMNVNDKSEDV